MRPRCSSGRILLEIIALLPKPDKCISPHADAIEHPAMGSLLFKKPIPVYTKLNPNNAAGGGRPLDLLKDTGKSNAQVIADIHRGYGVDPGSLCRSDSGGRGLNISIDPSLYSMTSTLIWTKKN